MVIYTGKGGGDRVEGRGRGGWMGVRAIQSKMIASECRQGRQGHTLLTHHKTQEKKTDQENVQVVQIQPKRGEEDQQRGCDASRAQKLPMFARLRGLRSGCERESERE